MCLIWVLNFFFSLSLRDAKIAALEKTSQETEKLIAEARSEKIRHMDEVHAAQKKVADLEARVKDLESKLAEKDAMIKVLQKHTYDKEVSASYPSIALGRSPHHTPHGSLNTDLLGTSVSREELGTFEFFCNDYLSCHGMK